MATPLVPVPIRCTYRDPDLDLASVGRVVAKVVGRSRVPVSSTVISGGSSWALVNGSLPAGAQLAAPPSGTLFYQITETIEGHVRTYPVAVTAADATAGIDLSTWQDGAGNLNPTQAYPGTQGPPGAGTLTAVGVYTSGSHTPTHAELVLYQPTSPIAPSLPAAVAGQRFGVVNLATGTATVTLTCQGSDVFTGGATTLVVAPGERAVIIAKSGGFDIESRTLVVTPTPDATTSVKGAAVILGGTADNPTVPWGKVTGTPTIPATYSDLTGTLPQAALPAVALTDFLGSVSSQTAMLALTGQRGDWCYRTDTGTDWQLVAEPSTTLSSWQEHHYPSSPVSSVAGRAGAVVLSKADVGLNQVDNTADAGKPVSTTQQAALDAKVDKATLTTKGDLYAGGSSGAPTRVPVGPNGRILTADDSQPAGLRWGSSVSAALPYTSSTAASVPLGGGTWTGIDTTAQASTATLPAADAAAVAGGLQVAVSWDAGKNTLTVAATGSDQIVTSTGVASTVKVTLRGEVITYQAVAVNRWRPVGSFKPKPSLDAVYGTIVPTHLTGWALAQAFRIVAGNRDLNGALTTAQIAWPDGSGGYYTTDTASASYPGRVDAWRATYTPSGDVGRVVTQPAVTRDGTGEVIAQPAVTITTNRALNGTLETDLAYWNGPGGTLTRPTAAAHDGSYGARWTAGASAFWYFGFIIQGAVVQPGETVTVALWARTSTTRTCRFGCSFNDASDSQLSVDAADTPMVANTWTRLTRTVTAPANARTVYVSLVGATNGANWTNGETVDADSLLIVSGAYVPADDPTLL